VARKKKKFDWKKIFRREGLIIFGFALLTLLVWFYFETSYLPKFPGMPGELPSVENFDAADSFEQAFKEYQNKKNEYDEYLAKNKYVGKIYRAVTLIPYPSFLLIRIIRWAISRKKQKKKSRAKRK
jgi:hypothetical protein